MGKFLPTKDTKDTKGWAKDLSRSFVIFVPFVGDLFSNRSWRLG